MKITIDFDKKEIVLEGKVNLQELFLKLADLNIDQSKYTLVQKEVSYTAIRNNPLNIGTPRIWGQPYLGPVQCGTGLGLNSKTY